MPTETRRQFLRSTASGLAAGWTAGCLLVASEFAFFATKASMLSELGSSALLRVVAFSVVQTAALVLVLVALCTLVARLWQALRSHSDFARALPLLPAAGLLAVLVLLLVDNFTYTVFGFGIVHSVGWVRVLYALAFSTVVVACWRSGTKGIAAHDAFVAIGPAGIAAALAALLLLGPEIPGKDGTASEAELIALGPGARPNIILLSGDGIQSNQTSLRGAEANSRNRDTTPFLRRLAAESLHSFHHFSNAGNTGGAMAALLTGRHPLATRVLQPPDALRGRDAYEHLPALLRRAGYRNLDLSAKGWPTRTC